MSPNRRSWIHAWLLLMPAAILLIGFTYYPAVGTVVDSLWTNGTVIRPSKFAGWDNYLQVMGDPVFRKVFRNTVLFALGTVPPAIALALLMALWVNGRLAGRGFVRLAYFTPTILPMIAVANIWLFFYSPGIGLLDQIGGWLGFEGHNWLGDSDTALACLMVMAVWKEAGFFMIFYLAALQTLPPDLIEAARLEGAGRWTIFRRITFPLLMPTTLFVLINALLNSFKMVDPLFVLTKGGPDNATNLLLYYIYETGFSFFDGAYASTLTVVLLTLLAAIALTQFTVLDRRIHYK
jgi:sn-glycerol 3-phosphate transport system permease protein